MTPFLTILSGFLVAPFIAGLNCFVHHRPDRMGRFRCRNKSLRLSEKQCRFKHGRLGIADRVDETQLVKMAHRGRHAVIAEPDVFGETATRTATGEQTSLVFDVPQVLWDEINDDERGQLEEIDRTISENLVKMEHLVRRVQQRVATKRVEDVRDLY